MRASTANIKRVVLAYGAYLRKTGDFERIAHQAYPLMVDFNGAPVRIPIVDREQALAKVYAKHLASTFKGETIEVEVAMHENDRGGVACIIKAAIYDPEHGALHPVRDMLWTRFMETNELPGRSSQ